MTRCAMSPHWRELPLALYTRVCRLHVMETASITNPGPRWDVDRQEAFALDNGSDEKWVVACRHGYIMGFARKADATDYRAFLWDARRRHDVDALNEMCPECADEGAAS